MSGSSVVGGSSVVEGNVLSGKALAALKRQEIKQRVEALVHAETPAPRLDVVLVGEDPASQVYVRNKERAAEKVGITGRVHRLPADSSQKDIESLVCELSADAKVTGILVQLPLPRKELDAERIVDCIDPKKDVDGLHPVNAGLLALGRPGLRPCTPSGCMALLEATGVSLEGASALVIGRSALVGMPVARMLTAANATVTVAHSRTRDLEAQVRAAEVLVVAAGKMELIPGDWVREGATVIDVGIHRREDGSLTGDVQFESAKPRARYITPVPGGVGPMTIAMLLENTVWAAEQRS